MCGILGILNPDKTTSRTSFKQVLDTLEHRGPDNWGMYHTDQVFLGHRRLSIIDISTQANQPFTSVCGKVHIVFNGEIYNYRALSKGLTLRTSSDTEVLLEGFIKHGVDFFNELRGIYTFCIHDTRDGAKSYIYRDPGGVKPLYFTKESNGLIFSSEIKGILGLLKSFPDADMQVIKQYIHLGYCPEPRTAYQNIYALDPGTLLTYDHNTLEYRELPLKRYSFRSKRIGKRKAVNHTELLLKQAVERNLVADVKINVALSGGIDSSLIYAYANQISKNKITGITVGFTDEKYDETYIASLYSRHIDAPHQIESIDVDGRLDLLNELLGHFDQPYADSSLIPFYFLTKSSAKHSKVLLGGDSGDEIHNGYSGYRILPVLMFFNRSFLKDPIVYLLKLLILLARGKRKRELKKIQSLIDSSSTEQMFMKWISWFPPDKAMYPFNPFKYDEKQVFFSLAKDSSIYVIIQYFYFYHRMLSDYLRKSDMMSMKNSIEFRVPMLDEDLADYSLQLPYWRKVDLFSGKKILKHLHSNVYPKRFSKLRKKGFEVPLDKWLKPDDIESMKIKINQCNLIKELIHSTYISYIFDQIGKDDEYTSRASVYQRILILYALALWNEKNFQEKTAR